MALLVPLVNVCGQDNAIDEDVDEQHVQDLALNVDNMFQVDDCDAFDSDVDKAPTTQTMFMANLSSANLVYDEAGPSYDSDILSEVHDHDHYQDVVCEHHEEHEMHDDVQPNYVVESHANYTSDSNTIPYEQYVKDNAVSVVQSNVSSVPNDAYMMIFNDMHELHAQSVSDTTRNTVVDNSLTAELATYKEQVELYKRWDSLLNHHALWENLNLIAELSDKDEGSSNLFHVEEFGNFTATSRLNAIPFTELNYTWFNQLNKAGNIHERADQMIGNTNVTSIAQQGVVNSLLSFESNAVNVNVSIILFLLKGSSGVDKGKEKN
ncbi:hypothetical protein Tco_0560965 [Tanacetum coccineum]